MYSTRWEIYIEVIMTPGKIVFTWWNIEGVKKCEMSFTDFRKKISLDVELCLTRMNICLEIYKFYCSEVFDRLLNFSLHLNCFIWWNDDMYIFTMESEHSSLDLRFVLSASEVKVMSSSCNKWTISSALEQC